jgi:tRNA A-37 threonylcarbamoyl transferase component Bud32
LGSATNPPRDDFPSIPGFEILSELGRGGMGVVYKARQIRLNRVCALKMLLVGEHTGADSRTRFLAEAETIAKVRHPNVVQIYGLGDHNGIHYFEMEYIEGGSLAHRLDGTPWAPESAARMIGLLARAIGDAHRLGIVHRDLKPGNVLLVDADTPKIVDFGLAKTLEADSNLTQSGVFVGTPSYAAPEQVEGLTGTIGPAADIYALGAIFYHMLTGRPPFQAATVLRTLEQVRTADPVPPSRLQPGLSPDAETICLKCLEKDGKRRYADAAALAEDLDRFLAGRPILARPIGGAERLWKWAWRRPAEALLSAAVVVVAVLGFILVSWQWRRAEGKAVAEAAANARAQQARLVAFEKQAELTFHQALALCDQGEVGRGLLWLARSLELTEEAQSKGLERPIRINLADWANQVSRLRRSPPTRHAGSIQGLAFHRGGRALDAPVEAIASTPNGRKVITGRRAGRLHVWDVETQRGFDLPPQGTEVTCLAVSPDGRVFASGTEGGVIRLWDTCLLGAIGDHSILGGTPRHGPRFSPSGQPPRAERRLRKGWSATLDRHHRRSADVGFDRPAGL